MHNFGYSALFRDPVEFHIAFFRDIKKNVDFLLKEYQKRNHCLPQHFLEVQGGPGYYASEFQLRGIASTNTDTSKEMLDFGQARTTAQKKIRWTCCHPHHLDAPAADLILFPLDNFTYFLDDESVLKFYDSIYNLMKPNGILVIEANHPKEIGYINYANIFTLGAKDYPQIKLQVEWGVNQPKFNLLTGVANTVIRFTREENQQVQAREIPSQERTNFPRDIGLLAEKSKLRVTKFFGDYDDLPLTWNSPLQIFLMERYEDSLRRVRHG